MQEKAVKILHNDFEIEHESLLKKSEKSSQFVKTLRNTVKTSRPDGEDKSHALLKNIKFMKRHICPTIFMLKTGKNTT